MHHNWYSSFGVECGLTCHTQCAHLVPDFCGMSMEAANQILETIMRTKNHNKTASMSNRNLRGAASQEPAPPAVPQKQVEAGYGAPPRQPSAEAVSAANNSYMPPQSPQAAQRHQMAQRPSSVDTAAKAAAAATGMRPPSQQGQGMFKNFPVCCVL